MTVHISDYQLLLVKDDWHLKILILEILRGLIQERFIFLALILNQFVG